MRRLPCVLVLSGLDPGGGAGLLADARAIVAAGAFATGVVTAQTVQSTRGLRSVKPVSTRLWMAQARAVLADQRVRAIKVGALGITSNVKAAASLLAAHRRIPAVVDPVLLPTRGKGQLLDARAATALRSELIPRATLVTANAREAAVITGLRVRDAGDAELAARAIVAMGARAALVKGGHLEGPNATDVLVLGSKALALKTRRVRTQKPIHGAGCILASLIAGRLARGDDVLTAVRWAKPVVTRAIAHSVLVGGDLAVLSVDA